MPVRWITIVCLLMPGPVGVCGAVTDVRSIDGSGNSDFNPSFGKAGVRLLRKAPVDYPGDGSGATMMTSPLRANPRAISNAVAAQSGSILNSHRGSDFIWQWGQFLDHDISLTGNSAAHGVAFIPVPAGDILGPNPIPFTRSEYDPATGTPGEARQQINQLTAFIDASNVYGSDDATALSLRTLDGTGRLATQAGGKLLPDDGAGGFLAGDVRAMEQAALTAMHTLFVREHNRLADALALVKPDADDDELYQTARKIVGAQMQVITYNEFLPALLGSFAPSAADLDYDETIDPGIANEFSTASYRFGHSMLSPNLRLVNTDGTDAGLLPLRDAFFNPGLLLGDPGMVDQLLAGLAAQQHQEMDSTIVDDVRSFLFGPPGAGGLDLASLNIQRGRDHGIADYNAMRVAYGLDAKAGFFDPGDGTGVTSDPDLAAALRSVYSDVDNMDAWVGGLAEDHLPGGAMGELVATVLIEQFTRLRDGDRFFYLLDPDLPHPDIAAVLLELYGTPDVGDIRLSDIIMGNTHIESLQRNVFFVEMPEPATGALLMLGAAGLLRRSRGRAA